MDELVGRRDRVGRSSHEVRCIVEAKRVKIWIAVGTVVVSVVVLFGGTLLGCDSTAVQAVVALIGALGLGLIGAHAYTDVRLSEPRTPVLDTKAQGLLGVVQSFAPVLLNVLGKRSTAPPSSGGVEKMEPEARPPIDPPPPPEASSDEGSTP